MVPPRKRCKNSPSDDPTRPLSLSSDPHAGWLVKSGDQIVELIARGTTLVVHRGVLTRNSEYFAKCFRQPWIEASKSSVTFDDIDADYLGLFVGFAYAYSTIAPKQPPQWSLPPKSDDRPTLLRDYIEVYKLCDRFICKSMGDKSIECIHTTIMQLYRELFNKQYDMALQKKIMGQFAQAYESLVMEHPTQKKIGEVLIDYVCEGIDYTTWDAHVDELVNSHRFVRSVSRGFARKLAELQTAKKLRRKMLNPPTQ